MFTTLNRARPSDKEFKEVIKNIRQKGVQKGYCLISPKALDYFLKWPDISKFFLKKPCPSLPNIPCFAGRFHFYITWNGLLSPCCGMMYEHAGVDIKSKGISKAIDELKPTGCFGCMALPIIEMNLWMNFNLESLWNISKTMLLSGIKSRRARRNEVL